jgi:hypothetical protein
VSQEAGSDSDAHVDEAQPESGGDGSQDAAECSDASVPDHGIDAETMDSPPDAQEMRCIEDWPNPPATVPKASLPNVTPELLWKKLIPALGHHLAPVLAGDKLGIMGGNRLWILDRQGNVTASLPDWGAFVGNGLSADLAGNFLVGTNRVRSVRPDGTVRWTIYLGPNLDTSNETTNTSEFLVTPDGATMYFVATDGFIYSASVTDGAVLWKKPYPILPGEPVARLQAGAGDTFFVRGVAYHAATGKPSGSPAVGDSPPFIRWASWNRQLAVAEYVGPGNYRGHVVDRCGKVRWSLPNTPESWSFLLEGYEGELLAYGQSSGQRAGYVFGKDGELLHGPVQTEAYWVALGADRILYALPCTSPGSLQETTSLRADTWSLQSVFTIDIGGPCVRVPGVVLADDGVLYVTRQRQEGIELLAFQTTSPGLAQTPYPTYRQNDLRTGWLPK